jgi:cell division protein FtsB
VKPLRWVAAGIAVAAVVFAVEAGEYSTGDYFTLRHEVRAQEQEVARLRVVVDSLNKVAVALETDPRVQEKVARESWGMLRKGEFFYSIVHDSALDSARGVR